MGKSLIIGGAGFVGGHLADALLAHGEDVAATKLENEEISDARVKKINLQILDADAVKRTIDEELPDRIYHLAAISSVAFSWKNPHAAVDVNIKGALNLLEAVRSIGGNIRVLMIGSGEEYGAVRPELLPINEECGLNPGNVYAVTKICQNMISALYAKAYGLDVMMVRAFNHCGPGQLPAFAISDFAKQIAEAEAGRREPVIYVGNLSARRDFTDVRDVVRAYIMLMEKGARGNTYNVGSGRARSIEEMLNRLISMAKCGIEVKTDEARFRPVDVPVIEADISKLKSATGWRPEIPVDKTLADTLEYWRSNI